MRRLRKQKESDKRKVEYLIDKNIPLITLNKRNFKNFDWNNFYEKYEASNNLEK
jgi:hypothetical protein